MTRIRNYEEAETLSTFERLPRRSKKTEVVSKATEHLIENLTNQNETLSRQNLSLSRLFREAYRLLPERARAEVDHLKAILSMDDLEVHP